MANTYTTLSGLFTAIADAIRGKTGSSAPIVADTFPSAIAAISTDGTGIDTSDATATAEDMAEGVTAYVNGEKVTGSVSTKESGTTYPATTAYDYQTVAEGSGYITMGATLSSNILFRSGAMLKMGAKKSAFGDATAADVAAGKTFTSAAGLLVTGTRENSGGTGGESTNNCEAYHITALTDTISFQGSGTVKVWGYASKGSSYSTTNYAFVGDGYYSGTYGSYTKTSAVFSINADGTLGGLPSDLSAIDLLVTIGV